MREVTRARRPKSRPFELAVLAALGMGALYFGQGIFVPLVLAVLVAFALHPVVDRMRRVGIPQLAAVLTTILVISALALAAAYVTGSQLLKLATDLPQYQQTVSEKLRALQGSGQDALIGRVAKAIEQLGNQIAPTAVAGPGPSPIPVTIADRPASPLEGLTGVFGSVLGPLATGTLVFIFSIFLLLEWSELRDRLLKLVSLGDIKTSTRVMDDAAKRVSRYLLVQLAVNCGFGIVFSGGMLLLGVPNALLWGLLAVIFRYIPFIGTFAAVLFPAALAFAVDPGWTMLVGVLGIYIALELVTTNAIEPNLYGSSTGLSAMAVLIAAIFWATLWGLIGLVLATPLTVCLVVLGRHVPQLGFLDVLLGSEPALPPEERFYQRLLAGNFVEAIELSEEELKNRSVAEFFDGVAIPALRLAAADLERDASDLSRRRNVVDGINAVLEEFDAEPVERANSRGPVLVVGGKTELDGATAAMLAHSLALAGIEARQVPPISLNKYGIAQLDVSDVSLICVCYIEPHPEAYVRYAAARLHRKKPGIVVLACLLGGEHDIEASEPSELRADAIARSIAEATEQTEKALGTATGPTADRDSTKAVNDGRLDRLRRFASQSDWLATASSEMAEEFKVPLVLTQLAPVGPAPAGAAAGGLGERVIAAGEPMVISDATLDKENADDAFLVENGFRSFVGVPLKLATGEAIGAVMLYDNIARDFTSDMTSIINRAAELISDLETRTADIGPVDGSGLVGSVVPKDDTRPAAPAAA